MLAKSLAFLFPAVGLRDRLATCVINAAMTESHIIEGDALSSVKGANDAKVVCSGSHRCCCAFV